MGSSAAGPVPVAGLRGEGICTAAALSQGMTMYDPPNQDHLSQEALLALDNIRLDLPVARVGSRVLAAFLDYLVLGVLIALWALLWLTLSPGGLGGWKIGILVVGIFLLEQGYFAGLEIALGGRTVGKLAVGLRVVSREGGSPDVASLLGRNLLRTPDLFVGVFFLAFDPLARRLGDRVGGTLVVHDRRRREVALVTRTPPGWRRREVEVVEALFARRDELEATQARHLALRLVAWLQLDAPELLAGTDPEEDPVGAVATALAVQVTRAGA